IPTRITIASSLAITFISSIGTAVGKVATGQVLFLPAIVMIIASIIGAPLGVATSKRMNTKALEWILILLILASSIKIWSELFASYLGLIILQSIEATSLIEEFGEDTYKQKIDEYIRQVLLRDRIAQDLEQEVIDENPDASEEEINYLTENKYDDLYMAQMETLEVEVHVH